MQKWGFKELTFQYAKSQMRMKKAWQEQWSLSLSRCVMCVEERMGRENGVWMWKAKLKESVEEW